MKTATNTDETRTVDEAKLPEPHRCPLWVHYLLVNPLRRLLESPRKLLGPHVAPGMTVLEPGCGFGYFSLPLARMVGPEGKVLCVDVEPRAIARLERRARKAGLDDRIDARACQPDDLGLDDQAGRVDLAVVLHTLHEIEDLPGFLTQVTRLLAPGGRMLVVEPPGHVKPEQFAAQLQCCREAGFCELAPPLGGKRPAALLVLPTS